MIDEELRRAFEETNHLARESLELRREQEKLREQAFTETSAGSMELMKLSSDFQKGQRETQEERLAENARKLHELEVNRAEFQGQVLTLLREQNELLEQIVAALNARKNCK